MTTFEIASLFRGAERLLIVGGGIVALYLGYRLFISGFAGGQTGEFVGKSLSIRLIKVGPGVFFALFGTFVLIAMTWQNIVMPIPNGNPNIGGFTFFGMSEKSRIERIIEDIGAIKTMIADGSGSKGAIVKALTQNQKTLARIYLGEEIYDKCEYNPPKKSDKDCQIYKRMIK